MNSEIKIYTSTEISSLVQKIYLKFGSYLLWRSKFQSKGCNFAILLCFFTFDLSKSLALISEPWKYLTRVCCRFSKPSNSRSGSALKFKFNQILAWLMIKKPILSLIFLYQKGFKASWRQSCCQQLLAQTFKKHISFFIIVSCTL